MNRITWDQVQEIAKANKRLGYYVSYSQASGLRVLRDNNGYVVATTPGKVKKIIENDKT